VRLRSALAALALLAASGVARADHPAHANPPKAAEAQGPKHGEQCSEAECPMHAKQHGDSGPHDAHAARHAALDRLVAIEDLQQLKARYMRCIDTKDLACLRDTVFTPATELSFKGADYEIAVQGWAEIEKFYEGAFTPQKFGMHQVHTREIEVNGDSATGLWYLHDVFINLEEGWTLQGSALYRDDYVKTSAGWRIAKSTYQRLWEETTPRSERTKLGAKPVKE
jgi:hypothetical protein